MVNFNSDQAEGLRRMLAGPRPRVFTFLSALSDEEKNAMLVNLGASLVRAGSDVMLMDARSSAGSIASRFVAPHQATLVEVARQQRKMGEALSTLPDSFSVARLAHATSQARAQLEEAIQDQLLMRRLNDAFGILAKQSDVVIIDGELNREDSFVLPAMASSEIVVQLTNSPESIKSAYATIKRLSATLGRRPFGVLVTGVSDKEAKVVYDNIAKAASRYLAAQITFMGSIPADEHLTRAAKLGRTVIDAFPMAGASVAFRKLAGRCTLSEMAMPADAGMQMAG